MNWLAPDSKFMRAWSNLVDGVWINILMLVTSIPIITIGAALTAGHDACRRSIEGEGKGVTSNYFKSFKIQLHQSHTAVAAVLGGADCTGLVMDRPADHAAAHHQIRADHPLAYRFRMGVRASGTLREHRGRHLEERLHLRHLPHRDDRGPGHRGCRVRGTAGGQLVHMPGGLFLLVILGYGTMLMLHIPVAERVFKPYLID